MAALAAIYDTVDSSRFWNSALEHLCDAFGAHGAMLALERPGEQIVDQHQYGFDPAWLDDYARNWAAKSPYLERFYTTPGNAGRFVTSESVLPYEHWIRSEMFHESGRTAGVHHGAAAFFDTADGMKVRLSCVRDRVRGPFTENEIRALDQLIPHIAQALRLRDAFPEPLSERLRELQKRQTSALVVDRALNIVAANDFAQALIESEFALDELSGRLSLTGANQEERLLRLVREVTEDPRRQRQMLVSSEAGPPLALVATAAPCRGNCTTHEETGESRLLALLTIVQRDRPRTLSPELLRELFDFTPAETRLAQWIASGQSPEETAAMLEVRISTVRWHLKRIFSKTGVAGQTELAALLQSLAHAASEEILEA